MVLSPPCFPILPRYRPGPALALAYSWPGLVLVLFIPARSPLPGEPLRRPNPALLVLSAGRVCPCTAP